mmetsp:Transcript_11351/g.23271  ORF Transcript_11351/g.23271 Transcript_11351/m.23271 type:complete len:271 (-) Transcript_11351:111-923(-)
MDAMQFFQSGFRIHEFFFQLINGSLFQGLFFECRQRFEVLANALFVLQLHITLLFLQQFHLLAQFEFRSTALFHEGRNLSGQGIYCHAVLLFQFFHLIRSGLHFLDRLLQLRLEFHHVLRIDAALGCHTFDQIGILMNGRLVLHIGFESLQAFFRVRCLSFDAFAFDFVCQGFLHLRQALSFQFLLQFGQLLLLFQTSLFQRTNGGIALTNFRFQLCSHRIRRRFIFHNNLHILRIRIGDPGRGGSLGSGFQLGLGGGGRCLFVPRIIAR